MTSRTLRASPWPIWGALASTFCMLFGFNWDISCHRSIGRDTVWTLPHIAIYLSLLIAFVYNAGLVLSHTWGRDRDVAVTRILGLSAPAGAFVTLWAVLLQFTSIVFDDWWHNNYGLDNIVFSPSHYILAFAISVFYLGQFMLVTTFRNVFPPERQGFARWVALIIWSFFLGHVLIGMDPQFGPMGVRSHAFLISCAAILPFALLLLPAYFGRRWSGVTSAALYMGGIILLMQLFRQFPATPGFGPVYHRVSYFLPPPFPILLVVPAFLVAWLYFASRPGPGMLKFLVVGAGFVVAFTATNWMTSAFLASDLADNRFFAGSDPGTVFLKGYRRIEPLGVDTATALSLLLSAGVASVSAWVGIGCGRWLRQIVR